MKSNTPIGHAAIAIVLTASRVAGTAACDSSQGPRTMQAAVAEADLVFHGEVVRVDYVMSEPTPTSSRGMPHTFVTYRVDHVVHGAATSPFIALRFIGGLEPGTDEFVMVAGTPRFDVGDEDILFVKDNDEAWIPLVDEANGRLRLIDGQAYSETGRSISIAMDGTIVRGDRYRLEDVLTTRVGNDVMVLGVDDRAKLGPSDAIPTWDLLGDLLIAAAVARAPAEAFRSADPSRAFSGPDLTPTPLPEREPDRKAPAPSPDPDDGSEVSHQGKGR